MLLSCRDISVFVVTLGTLSACYMRSFMLSWIIGLDGPYMWYSLTEYSGFSGQLWIIPSRK